VHRFDRLLQTGCPAGAFLFYCDSFNFSRNRLPRWGIFVFIMIYSIFLETGCPLGRLLLVNGFCWKLVAALGHFATACALID
jgi:hypothetical protein